MTLKASESSSGESTFRSIFVTDQSASSLRVPDYQRAYSWEERQINLFLTDLGRHQASGRPYYFGHFIVESRDDCWEIVDGQQRITTFVLFLLVCKHHLSAIDTWPESAASLLNCFSTVSYDREAFLCIVAHLGDFLARNSPVAPKHPPDSEVLQTAFGLTGDLTRSQRRMMLALLQMDLAFRKADLDREKIGDYIEVVMDALCSHHLTYDKSVAVNVFEMHNTRGVPLTTLEKVKAVLMKFVYEHGVNEVDRDEKVKQIQDKFGEIYCMEEHLAERSFRGEMTMDLLLRLHLRVVDDGSKTEAKQFHSPAVNADAESLVAYVEKRLRFVDDEKGQEKTAADGVDYALRLASELKKSVWIASEHLWLWDKNDPLVGDVMILERELSCEFFLVVCRRLESFAGKADGTLGHEALALWERFLFIRDFHDAYHRLWYKDDFPKFFAELGNTDDQISGQLRLYLETGFRAERTQGLQALVDKYLMKNRTNVQNHAFHWWKGKLIYALYKYEANRDEQIRNLMKGKISVEHILPQQWDWIRDTDVVLKEMADEQWNKFRESIDGCINGLGNLLLLTPGENTGVGNTHPADKCYGGIGGSYQEHNENREQWRSSKEWHQLIQKRGERIFGFMRRELIAAPVGSEGPP